MSELHECTYPYTFLLSFGSHPALHALVASQAWVQRCLVTYQQDRAIGQDWTSPYTGPGQTDPGFFIQMWLLMEDSGTRAAAKPWERLGYWSKLFDLQKPYQTVEENMGVYWGGSGGQFPVLRKC